MKRVAIGARMHSGWGALVCVSSDAGTIELIDRRRVVVTDPKIPGAKQPYHFAKNLGLPEAGKYLTNCAAASEGLALAALRDAVQQLRARDCRILGAAVLLASGRPLPPLPEILASHALIHTAEGEFFRRVVREACERLEIPVTGFRERDLGAQAGAALGRAATRVQHTIDRLGRSLGPPWTKDHKVAALAACILLAGGGDSFRSHRGKRGPADSPGRASQRE